MSDLVEVLPPSPGNRLSSQLFKDNITDKANFNDLELEKRVQILTDIVSGLAQPHIGTEMPDSAVRGDLWLDSSNNYAISVCITPYADTPLAEYWVASRDAITKAEVDGLTPIVNSATQTLVQPTMPDPAVTGMVWVNTAGNLNYAYVCEDGYELGGGIPPGTEGSQWRLISDPQSEILAVSIQNLDHKTATYFQADVPDAADGYDFWVDSDDFSTWVARRAYIATDGDAWSAGTYAAGRMVAVSTDYYLAERETTEEPSINAVDWTLLGTYATKGEFRLEANWYVTKDVVAQNLANAAATVASGKSTVRYSSAIPNPTGDPDFLFMYVNDVWVDQATGAARVCITQYGPDEGTLAKYQAMTDAEAAVYIEEVRGIADSKKQIFYQNEMPVAADDRDIWVDKDIGNRVLINNMVAYAATDGAAFNGLVDPPYALGDIRRNAGSYWQSTIANNTSIPGVANWTQLTFPTPQVVVSYAGGSTYPYGYMVVQDAVIYRSKTSTERLPNKGHTPGTPDGADWWEVVTATVSDVTTFRAQCWWPTIDPFAKSIADDADSLADGKAESFYQDATPDHANVGDIWTDTDDPIEVGKYRQWKCISDYDDRPLAYQGAVADHWNEHVDAVAQAVAAQAVSIADWKRTTFYTSVAEPIAESGPTSRWPGSPTSGNSQHIAIDVWDQLSEDSSGHVAREGDLWINIYSGVPYTRVCKLGYKGKTTDQGSYAADWMSGATDGLLDAIYFKRSGLAALTGPIDFTPVAGSQILSGNKLIVGTPLSPLGDDCGTVQLDFKVEQDLYVGGSVTVTGNLTINGTLSYINTTNLEVTDSMIKLAVGNPADTLDIGFYGKYITADPATKFTGLFRDASDGTWVLYDSLATEPTTTVSLAGTNPAPLKTGKLTIDSDHATVALDAGAKQVANIANPTGIQTGEATPAKWVDDKYLKVVSAGTPATAGTVATLNVGIAVGEVLPIKATIPALVSGDFWMALRRDPVTPANNGTVVHTVANSVLTTDADGETSAQTIATGFNKAIGTSEGTVAAGDHVHAALTAPVPVANSAAAYLVSETMDTTPYGMVLCRVHASCGTTGTPVFWTTFSVDVGFRYAAGAWSWNGAGMMCHGFRSSSNDGGYDGGKVTNATAAPSSAAAFVFTADGGTTTYTINVTRYDGSVAASITSSTSISDQRISLFVTGFYK